LTKENVIKNIGRKIVYVRKCDVDNNRGYVFTKYGILKDIHYSNVILENDCIDKRDVLECGICELKQEPKQ